jgi:hypothetical protein
MIPPHVSLDNGLSIEEYVFLREEIRHQDNLINARLSWLVSSQSFLLSGFAVTLNGSAQSLLPIYAKLKCHPSKLTACGGAGHGRGKLSDNLGRHFADEEYSASCRKLASATPSAGAS